MRLTQITIENFGIYEGLNTFKFPYNNKKKVSVIIGKNGAGKTTFLNAVKACFFGSMILKHRTNTKSYEEFILNKLNVNAQKDGSSHFSVEATFISHLHKFDGEYMIKRSWTLETGKFDELVKVKRNNILLTVKEQEEFFNVMYHAFPLDLFELFYLDGEKIDQLSVLNSNLIDLIESSINIDLFKNLKSDLITYAIKKVNSKQLERLEQNKTSSLEILESYNKEISQLSDKKELTQNNLINYASNLNRFKDSLNLSSIDVDDDKFHAITTQINEEKRSVQELLTSYLPYALLKDQLKTIEANIDHEESSKTSQIIQNAMSIDLETYLIKKIGDDDAPVIKETLGKIKKYYSVGNQQFIHRLNSEDYYNLKSKLSELFDTDQQILIVKIAHVKKLENDANHLSKEIEAYNTAKKAGQLDELLKFQNELSTNKIALEQIIAAINETSEKIIKRQALLEETEKEIWKELKKSNINNILDQLNTVLGKYIATIKNKKIRVIEDQTKYMFDRLIRKQGFIKDFTIKDNMIYLLDDNNNHLDHSHLSAGEKQLFVLSLIYAIIQSSERTVPMVFDTLLSRLDEGHRNNVFKEFISSCPDQVIILATDSELANIDREFLNSLTNIEYTIDLSKKDHQMIETR
ncbi:DNA sulfur modification protein DndD [Acetobacterium sp.]|uniref:DNA sulfur modification protein DndD n=1 Tax=Acetobacterium sp. TaxID=1872094 RepID=UPI002F42F155